MEILYKICKIESSGCGLNLELNETNFYFANKEKNWFQPICKKCQNKKSILWQQNHKDICNTRSKKYNQKTPMQRLWAKDCIRGHRRSGYVINFSILELYEIALKTIKCAYCDITLDWSKNKGHMNKKSPSLDNRDLKQNLDINDISIVCLSCNTTKNNRTFNDFISLCQKIKLKYGNSYV